ncbi:hypothetical protein [Micromonospora peucetia]|uniref:hypothetical protein n=1 Tax=Micromonospora peucetia TaxID=47871 RepID=UPI000B8676E9|nr:hypothetical protein [Micromonospora peucetia]
MIPCAESVGSAEEPDAELVVIADAVALPGTRVLQAQLSTEDEIGPGVLFAKAGVLVRRGHAVELLIDDSQAGKAWLGWGTPATPSSHVRVDACDQPDEWLAFAGGYWVRSAGCVRGKVSVDGGPWREFTVPIGAPCSEKKVDAHRGTVARRICRGYCGCLGQPEQTIPEPQRDGAGAVGVQETRDRLLATPTFWMGFLDGSERHERQYLILSGKRSILRQS